jgi:hypothetical protein
MYRFVTFAGVTLPLYNRQTDQTGGTAQSTLVRTINGSFDRKAGVREVPPMATFGMRALIADGATLTIEGDAWVVGDGDRMVVGDGDVLVFVLDGSLEGEGMRAQIDQLRGLIGETGTLVRSPLEDDAEEQEITARLLWVRMVTAGRLEGYQGIDLAFEAAHPYWHGEANSVARVSTTINATNDGNAPVRDAVLTVTGAIASSVVVTGPGINFTWTGALSLGQLLVISGNTVTANGSPSKVTINSGHTRDVLIELEPGATALSVVGGASAALVFDDAWQ